MLTALAVFSAAYATEMRSPWISERGPIRYVFEKGNPDRYSLDFWATGYCKFAHKAFLKHGTDTHPLTSLFFNKSEFKLSELFADVNNFQNEKHNPYIYIVNLYPRATYFDWGMALGGRFEYPVYEDKGRVGLRLSIPFRNVRIERDDEAERNATGQQDTVLKRAYRKAQTVRNAAGNGTLTDQDIWAGAINAELLRQLPRVGAAGALVRGLYATAANTNYVWATNYGGYANLGAAEVGAPLVITYHPRSNKTLPRGKLGAIKFAANARDHNNGNDLDERDHLRDDFNPDALANDFQVLPGPTTQAPGPLTQLPTTGQGFQESRFYVMHADGPADYTNFPVAQWENIWFSTAHANDGGRIGGADAQINAIFEALDEYPEDVTEWLWDNDFMFATNQRTGLGDIDLDLFYEHTFSDEWIGEVMLGIRFPTGANDDYYGNPYKAHLGNGEHFEIKLGGLMAWQPVDWMNAKIDLCVSFALEATEQRCAVFQGSTIKNIGPKADADVDWVSFTGRLDFNFFHPKTKDISSLIGYEFYYKGEDNIDFKQSTMETWLGKKWNATTRKYDTDDNRTLDPKLAENNTEAIGHKVRFEGRYQANQWLELFAGGSYVFAGQNLPRETDCHAGANVKF